MLASERKNTRKKTSKANARMEIIFSGPLLFVPAVEKGLITGVEVFAPKNDHPMGSVFLPGTWFSLPELEDPECERWPERSGFSLLDPHSYSIELTQIPANNTPPLRVSQIPSTNHKVKPGRRLSSAWSLAFAVRGKLSKWSSHRLNKVMPGMFVGADAPQSEFTAALHKLTYESVTGAEFYGAGTNQRAYLRDHAAEGGSLIVLGEVPYQPTLAHERKAIDAIANLAGLDLCLADTTTHTVKAQLMLHTIDCGHSIILVPDGQPTP